MDIPIRAADTGHAFYNQMDMTVKTRLHSFNMGDVEDPYLMAGFPIGEWQKTEHGRWVMEHCIGQPVFHCFPDPVTHGYRVNITGELSDHDYLFFELKWGVN